MKKMFKTTLCLALCAIMLLGMSVGTISSYADKPDFSVKENSPLKGIKVAFYGDSICAANIDSNTEYANVRGWAGRIGVSNGMKWTNFGVSGYSVSTVRGVDRTIMAQLRSSIKQNHEMIILHGGTNDAWDGAPVGTMTEGFGASDSYDVTTFAGGLEQLFAYIKENNPDATVGYIINFKFTRARKGATGKYTDEDGKVKSGYLLDHMNDYVRMTKQVCDKWGVRYLDLFSDDELTDKLHPYTVDYAGKTYQTTYLYDFIHPSSEGYNIIYPYIEDFMIKLVTPGAFDTTVPVTEPVTEPVTTPVTEPADKKEGGCKSFAGASVALASVISLAGACVLRKKKSI